MALRDGRWRFRLQLDDGRTVERTTDDMTLTQVDLVERTCGFAWGYWDPPRSARTAVALFAVLLMVDGETEDKALQMAGELPARHCGTRSRGSHRRSRCRPPGSPRTPPPRRLLPGLGAVGRQLLGVGA
jgi:hypothetical protein